MKSKILLISFFSLLLLGLPAAALAVDIAPRISDREIIEKLAVLKAGQVALGQRVIDLREEMKAGQAALRSEMKAGQAALRSEMKAGQAALGQRMDDMNQSLNQRISSQQTTILALFSSMVALILALFAYIAWDRRTMLKPVVDRLEHLEKEVMRDLDIGHKDGSLLTRLVKAVKELAKNDERAAAILRNLSLL